MADNTAYRKGWLGGRGGVNWPICPVRACCLKPLAQMQQVSGIAAGTDCWPAPPQTPGVNGTAARPTCRGGGCPLKRPIGVAGAASIISWPAPQSLLWAPLAAGRHLRLGLATGLWHAITCSRLHFGASVLTLHRSEQACIGHHAQAATVSLIGTNAISGRAL